MTDCLEKLIATRGYAVADGAMGTKLFEAGLESGESPELWNVTNSETISDIHRAYTDAGANVLLTNSFGANRLRLNLHGLGDRTAELNEASARNARLAAANADHPVLVAGSMGPTGELLEPLGTLAPEAAAATFAEQAAALAAGGVDLVWIETMSDLAEVDAAVRGARRACDLPVVATMSFDTAGRTMMGVRGNAFAQHCAALGLAAMGANCGNNIADTEAAVLDIVAASPGALVISKPNAGIPVWSEAGLVYDGTPQMLAEHAARVSAVGGRIIGTCCGSTEAHTAAISAALDTQARR